jgi:hypothetical protein
MNVYQLNYTEDFIKSLPVKFNKIKNLDLKTIPSDYHCLFTTDWNWGSHSKMRMEDRIFCEQLFHEYNRLTTKIN